MKEMKEDMEGRKHARTTMQEKREQDAAFCVAPDVTTLDFERQLRKVATRGGGFLTFFYDEL